MQPSPEPGVPVKPKKKLPGWALALIIVSAVILSLALCAGSFFLVLRVMNSGTKQTKEVEEVEDEVEESLAEEEEVLAEEEPAFSDVEEDGAQWEESAVAPPAVVAEESTPYRINPNRREITDTALLDLRRMRRDAKHPARVFGGLRGMDLHGVWFCEPGE